MNKLNAGLFACALCAIAGRSLAGRLSDAEAKQLRELADAGICGDITDQCAEGVSEMPTMVAASAMRAALSAADHADARDEAAFTPLRAEISDFSASAASAAASATGSRAGIAHRIVGAGPGDNIGGDDTKTKTYSILLFPAQDWVDRNKGELEKIKLAFEAFGTAIGDSNDAVWMYAKNDRNMPDVGRSAEFARALGLDVNGGPYVIETTINPRTPRDLARTRDFVLVKLKQIDGAGVAKVLNVLQEGVLRGQNEIGHALVFEEVKQRFLSIMSRNPDGVPKFVPLLIELTLGEPLRVSDDDPHASGKAESKQH